MNPYELIDEFYPRGSKAHGILIRHSEQVARKAVAVAEGLAHHLDLDIPFIQEAAMLHDIGILYTRAPEIGCHGDQPYVVHGYLGGLELEKLGFPRHALVCERHVGVGISMADIKAHALPLPLRDMLPVTMEEKIICFADKFFSKDHTADNGEKSLPAIVAGLQAYGRDKAERFKEWAELFGFGAFDGHGNQPLP